MISQSSAAIAAATTELPNHELIVRRNGRGATAIGGPATGWNERSSVAISSLVGMTSPLNNRVCWRSANFRRLVTQALGESFSIFIVVVSDASGRTGIPPGKLTVT